MSGLGCDALLTLAEACERVQCIIPVCGSWIFVQWDGDTWYRANVTENCPRTGRVRLVYDDGDVCWTDLTKRTFSFDVRLNGHRDHRS